MSKFEMGDRVELTTEGIEQGFHIGRSNTEVRFGTVVGIPDRSLVRVRKDGYKKPTLYWHGYWKKVDIDISTLKANQRTQGG